MRHRWLIALSLGAALSASAATGDAVPGLAVLDTAMTSLMHQYGVPGAALAVTRNGRLVLARGYGLADKDAGLPVLPTTPFRLASLSKPITAAAIMKLAEERRLDLDAKVVPLLGLQGLSDPRWSDITVRNLLEHSGGWNRDLAGAVDPINEPLTVAATMGTASPPSVETIIAYMARRPLDFSPGTSYAYSPFGYLLLGRVIERVTGLSYGPYVQSLLVPFGVRNMFLGGSRSAELHPDESHYYDYPGAGLAPSVFSNMPGSVARPDGGLAMGNRDAPGGWVMSAIEYARFLRAIEPQAPGTHLLSSTSVDNMLSRPSIPLWQGASAWYAKGWLVRPGAGVPASWHNGSFPGTATYAYRASDGTNYVALFNSLDARGSIFADIDARLGAAIQSVDA